MHASGRLRQIDHQYAEAESLARRVHHVETLADVGREGSARRWMSGSGGTAFEQRALCRVQIRRWLQGARRRRDAQGLVRMAATRTNQGNDDPCTGAKWCEQRQAARACSAPVERGSQHRHTRAHCRLRVYFLRVLGVRLVRLCRGKEGPSRQTNRRSGRCAPTTLGYVGLGVWAVPKLNQLVRQALSRRHAAAYIDELGSPDLHEPLRRRSGLCPWRRRATTSNGL